MNPEIIVSWPILDRLSIHVILTLDHSLRIFHASTNLPAHGPTFTNLSARSPTSTNIPVRSPTRVIHLVMNLPIRNNSQL